MAPAPQVSAPAPAKAQPAQFRAVELRRLPAAEARQGAAVDAHHVYAINNTEIGKYDKRTGRRVAGWSGAPGAFTHLNSCAVFDAELVCAHSNYPGVPMASSVETFDTRTLTHTRSLSLGRGYGSLTWLDRRDGFWWAAYANYDARGGEPGRDGRFTTLVKHDDRFQPLESWSFPASVLERFLPSSTSGGAWGANGRLYVSVHDAAELYVLQLPRSGSTLVHVATVAVSTPGQAFAFDRTEPDVIWSIDRSRRELVQSRLPTVNTRALR